MVIIGGHINNSKIFQVIQDAAVNGKHVVYIIEDYQLLNDAFLQSINSLLSSGDIPGIFTVQEFDSFLTSLREQASQDAFRGDLYSYYVMSLFFIFCFFPYFSC